MNPDIYAPMSSIEKTHWWFVARRRYLNNIIKTFIRTDENSVFCEAGCGTGGNLSLLSQFAPVDGVEIEQSAIEIAKSKNIKGVRRIEHGYLPDNVPFTGPYTAVFSLDVIEHIEADLASLQRITELVEDNGHVILTVPAYQWLWSNHDVESHHKRRYTKKNFTELVGQAGLNVVYASYFNTLLFPLAVIARFADKLSKKSESEQADGSDILKIPPTPVNKLFTTIFGLEKYFAGKVSMPFGLSIVVVAQKKTC